MRVALLSLVLALVHGSGLVAQEGDRSDRAERDVRRDAKRDGQNQISKLEIHTGYVFVNGQYVQPPYRIEFSESEVFINEATLDLSAFEVWKNEKKRRNGVARSPGQQVRRNLRDLLDGDGSLVGFDGQPVHVLDENGSYELLRVLVNVEARTVFNDGERQWLPGGIDESEWNTWINEFECPEELARRAGGMLTRIEEAERANGFQISARRTLESCAYPLTVVGMLLVVMALGHLLSFKPDSEGESAKTQMAKRAVTRSLALVAALSALDLVWTLLVSRAGDMKELNPLGATLIDDPFSLIALKTIATSISVTLLFTLRQHRVAQQGAWWACLICTLLTVRWLTFTSMFS